MSIVKFGNIAPLLHAQFPSLPDDIAQLNPSFIFRRLSETTTPPPVRSYHSYVQSQHDTRLFTPFYNLVPTPNVRQTYNFFLAERPDIDIEQLQWDAKKTELMGRMAANLAVGKVTNSTQVQSILGRFIPNPERLNIPLAGTLLTRYMVGDGSAYATDFDAFGVGSMMARPAYSDERAFSLADMLYRLEGPSASNGEQPSYLYQLLHDVAQYFKLNPHQAQVAAASPWRSMEAAHFDDTYYALGYFSVGLSGNFTMQETLDDGSIILEGLIQGKVADTYDFANKKAEAVSIRGFELINQESLYLFAHPEINLANIFDVELMGPVTRIKVKVSPDGEIVLIPH